MVILRGMVKMSTLASTENKLDNNQYRHSICYAFGCQNKSTEKIKICAGTFGTITLKLCNKCVNLFKNNNALSCQEVFQK